MTTNVGPYSRSLSRQYPGLFVILLDQSDSMSQLITHNNQTKASLVTSYVNAIIQRLIELAEVEFKPGGNVTRKKYAYLSVIGYNDIVSSLLGPNYMPIDIPSLLGRELGELPITRKILDGNGNVKETVHSNQIIWIKPNAEGNTDMAQAFEVAERVVQGWLTSPPELISEEMGYQAERSQCFPPIVINITDAKNNGNRNPQKIVERIQQLDTDIGNVLVCNCHFTNEPNVPCTFPESLEEVRKYCQVKEDLEVAKRMFEMSSVIPEELLKEAQRYMQKPINSGARGFVFNASPEILLKFLRWTTLGNLKAGARI